MGANIEIKARSRDWERQVAAACELAGGPGEVIEQVDTFFRVPSGRLKLRQLGESRGELIFYERRDLPGPKLSEYNITPTATPVPLRNTLARALGVSAEVRKRRLLFISRNWNGHTRIHLDEVDGLGRFVELEVVLGPGETPEQGETIAGKFRAALDIRDPDLIDCAYVDLLTAHGRGT